MQSFKKQNGYIADIWDFVADTKLSICVLHQPIRVGVTH